MEETTLCSNCQRPIAASNFVTHNLHCQRNLIKCEKCGEAVPRSGMEEHDAEFHSTVNCPDCHVSVDRPLLDNHKKTACQSRQQDLPTRHKTCPYCELELHVSDIDEHENYCGSRTKICEECGEYVMLKYEQLHLDSNHRFLKLDDEPGPTPTWIKNDIESFSSGTKGAKQNNCKKPQLSTGKFDNVDEDDVDDMQSLFASLMKKKKAVGTNPHYPGVAYPLFGGPQRTVTRSPPAYQDNQDDLADLVALPCEFCEAMIPVNQLFLHQTGCRPDIVSFGKVQKASYSNQSESKKRLNNLDAKVKNFMTSVKADDVDFEDQKKILDQPNISRLNLIKNTIDKGLETPQNTEGEDDGIILPCEFCGDGYPPSLLLEHQNVCDYHPKNTPDLSPMWTEPQDLPHSNVEPFGVKSRRFYDGAHNNFVDSDQTFANSGRGKSNISNSYNDLRGNFTVASEWSDDSDSRPTSATGAIPKQKAGKINSSWKVNQEVPSTRPPNSLMVSHSRAVPDGEASGSIPKSDLKKRLQIHNKLKDVDDDDEL